MNKQETLEEAAELYEKTRVAHDELYIKSNDIEDLKASYYYKGRRDECIKWQAERMGLMEIELRHTKTLLASCEKALEDRDKQAERMYSEEDIINALHSVELKDNKDYTKIYEGMKDWFEQHKKK